MRPCHEVLKRDGLCLCEWAQKTRTKTKHGCGGFKGDWGGLVGHAQNPPVKSASSSKRMGLFGRREIVLLLLQLLRDFLWPFKEDDPKLGAAAVGVAAALLLPLPVPPAGAGPEGMGVEAAR